MDLQSLKNQFKDLKQSFSEMPCSEIKINSFEKFLTQGLPTQAQEDFRYSNLRGLKNTELLNYQSYLTQPQNLFDHGFDFPVNSIVFRNGIFDKQLSQLSREVIDKIKFKDHGCLSPLRPLSQLMKNSFYNLNLSFNIETFYLDIPENTVINEPIAFNFLYDTIENNMVHPQLDLMVGENSQVKFIEYHKFNGSDSQVLINPVTKVRLGQRANVKYVRVANFKKSSVHHTGHIISELSKNSVFNLTSVNNGGQLNRLDGEFYHKDERSELILNGLCFAEGSEQVNYLTRVFHEKGYGESHQLYKSVLADESISSFDGLIYIAPKAQKVNSSQMNKNLLLSDKAQVFTKPQLNINADDVKAAHGATVSELSDDEIFYLTSRGINKKDAKKIMEKAFIDEVILKVGDLHIQKWLKNEVG